MLAWIQKHVDIRDAQLEQVHTTSDESIAAIDKAGPIADAEIAAYAASEALNETAQDELPDVAKIEALIAKRARDRSVKLHEAMVIAHAAYADYLAWCDREDQPSESAQEYDDRICRRITAAQALASETVH